MNKNIINDNLVKIIASNIERNIIIKNLHSTINKYCIEVSGIDKEHILLDDVYKMFPNVDIIDFTILYAKSCLEDLTDNERNLIQDIIYYLNLLKSL